MRNWQLIVLKSWRENRPKLWLNSRIDKHRRSMNVSLNRRKFHVACVLNKKHWLISCVYFVQCTRVTVNIFIQFVDRRGILRWCWLSVVGWNDRGSADQRSLTYTVTQRFGNVQNVTKCLQCNTWVFVSFKLERDGTTVSNRSCYTGWIKRRVILESMSLLIYKKNTTGAT